MDDHDLFSYDNSGNLTENDTGSFDLNSFSSHTAEPKKSAKRTGRRKKKGKGKDRILRGVLTVFLIGLITFSIIVSAFLLYAFTMVDGTMDEDLDNLKLNFTTTIYIDNDKGEPVEYQRLHGEFNRIWVAYNAQDAKEKKESYTGIPQDLVNAFVAIEDKRFFEHSGVDWKRTFSAFANMFFHFYSSNQGGSTITQQLVKNLTGDTSQKPSRKIREIMRARYFESKYAKDTIIECYLNTIAMGHGTYGVEVASNYYFGKSVDKLTLAECASLAAITKSPSAYAPDDHPEDNAERRKTVLSEMLNQGYISKEEYNAALEEDISIVASRESLNESEINSYFVDALISQVVSDLSATYGYEEQHASKLFYSGGYKIYATVDPKIQDALETVFKNSSAYGIKSSSGDTLQGSMTVMDYRGHVLGLVGGIGEKDTNRSFNRATDAVRQPGSTIKPLSAYAPAIEQDLIRYSSVVNDVKTSYNGWTPVNWYNSYWGKVTVQYALERSINTIPVYLVNKLTPQVSYDFLTQKLGVTTLTAEDVNLSPLGMGGTNGGLTTLESAAAFAIFGNSGLYYAPTLYSKVTDQRGDIVLEYNETPSMAISEDTATIMNHLLQQVVYGAKGTGTSAQNYITNMKVYAKTGTSNSVNDLWFVGGTPYYIASCWCGYDQQQKISNTKIAQTLWGNVMSKIHKGLKEKEFTDSEYTVDRYYCTSTGNLATASCPSKAVGWFKTSNLPGSCTAHGGKALPDPKTYEAQLEKEKSEAEAKADSASKTESSASASKPSDSSGASKPAKTAASGESSSTSAGGNNE